MSNNTEQITDQLRAVLAINEIETYGIDEFDNKKLTFVLLSRSYLDSYEIEILKNYGFDVRSIILSHIETRKYHWETCLQLLIRARVD